VSPAPRRQPGGAEAAAQRGGDQVRAHLQQGAPEPAPAPLAVVEPVAVGQVEVGVDHSGGGRVVDDDRDLRVRVKARMSRLPLHERSVVVRAVQHDLHLHAAGDRRGQQVVQARGNRTYGVVIRTRRRAVRSSPTTASATLVRPGPDREVTTCAVSRQEPGDRASPAHTRSMPIPPVRPTSSLPTRRGPADRRPRG